MDLDKFNYPKIQEGNSKQRRENGKAIHVSALQKFKEKGYTIEYPIEYSTFNKNKYPFVLSGRIDAIHFDKQEIVDIKTTTKPIEKINMNPYILQVGTYTKIIELQTKKQFSAHILLINTTQHIISLTREQIESAYKEMIKRAIHSSRFLKQKFQDISSLSHSNWNHEKRVSKTRQWNYEYPEKHEKSNLKWMAKHPEKEYCRIWLINIMKKNALQFLRQEALTRIKFYFPIYFPQDNLSLNLNNFRFL